MEHIKKGLINKFDQHFSFDKEDLETMIAEGLVVAEFEGKDYYWQKSITTIVELDGRYFSITWMKSLIESLQNDFVFQPIEISKETAEKLTISAWRNELMYA